MMWYMLEMEASKWNSGSSNFKDQMKPGDQLVCLQMPFYHEKGKSPCKYIMYKYILYIKYIIYI